MIKVITYGTYDMLHYGHIRLLERAKEHTLAELKTHGYWCRDCIGNFIFVKPNHDAREVAQQLKVRKKVLVHPYGNELLKDYLRVSVGSKTAMKIFLDAFFEMDGNR